LHVLDVSWSDVTLDAACVASVADILQANCTLTSLPLERLLVAAPPNLRHQLLDNVKFNIGLCSSVSHLLLPWSVRVQLRRFAGYEVPADIVSPDPADAPVSDLVLESSRLSPQDTWVYLNRGAFGLVFCATLDGRPVCVKVITRAPGVLDEEDRGMGFIRELALMHELRPQSNARRRCVYARHVIFPPGSAHTIWLVLDMMDNGSLNQAVAQLTPAQRLQVLADVSSALNDLHLADVLHRDLAARNVLLDSLFRAYLCDFGLSCRSAYAWECPEIPTYDWAPEMFLLEDATYTKEADVWSFGVLMLSTFLGRNPLRTLARGTLKAMYRVWATAAAQPVPELDAIVHVAAPELDSEFELKNYELRTRRNYRSVYRPSREVHAVDNQHPDPAQWWDAYMTLPAATPRDRALCLLAHTCCRWNPVERPGVALVADLLSHVVDEAPHPKEFLFVHSVGEVLLLAQWWLLGERVAHTWRVDSSFRLKGTPAQCTALRAMTPRLQAELVAAELAGNSDAAVVGPCLSRLAVLLDAQGATAEASYLHTRALTLAEAAGRDSAEVARGLLEEGLRLKEIGDDVKAAALLQRALVMCEDVHGLESMEVAAALSSLGIALQSQGNFMAALPLVRRALAIHEKNHGPQHSSVATSLSNLAVVLKAQGDVAAAIPLYRRALEIREAALGPQHPDVAISLNNLAQALHVAAAIPLYQRALEIREAVLGPQHLLVATSLSNLAVALQVQGDAMAAVPLFMRAQEIHVATLGLQHPLVAQNLNGLAAAFQAQGNLASALPLYRRAQEILIQVALGPKFTENTHHTTLSSPTHSSALSDVFEAASRGDIDAAHTLGYLHLSRSTDIAFEAVQ
jgi:serine/threonine protein kinase/tetratricopeptide (TPR) repeat protein